MWLFDVRRAAIGWETGGLLASAIELISGALTKDVVYTIATDLQLTEKTSKGKKKHQVWVASTAEQINLEWEVAQGKLMDGFVKSLGGLLYNLEHNINARSRRSVVLLDVLPTANRRFLSHI